MTTISLQNLGSSPEVFSAAMVFSTKLLTQRSSNAPPSDLPEEKPASFDVRATQMTSVLKSIPGYIHGGIND